MTSERRGTLQLIGVACLILGGIFVILCIPLFWAQIRVLRSWPVSEAAVVSSHVATQPSGRHGQVYSVQLTVEYPVKNQPVTVELTNYQGSSYIKTARQAAEFPVGSRHAVRYDPSNPKDARLGAGWNWSFFALPLITSALAAFFGMLAAGFFLAGRQAAVS